MRLSLIAVLLLWSSLAWPQQRSDLAYSRNARSFETLQSSLLVKGMAHACLSMTLIPDSLPCQPAYTPFTKKSMLGMEVLLSNGYANLTNVQKLLDGRVSQDLVDTLFSNGQILQIEANADILFRSRYLNGRFTPATVKGFSVVRNEANPDVEIFAVEEKGFTFQSGAEIFENLYAGAQVRILSRKFIRQRFKLVELGTPAGKDLLKPKEQSATYFEPGLSYIFPVPWRPRFSLLVANLGSVSQEFQEFSVPVDPQLGFGISPPVYWGDLDLSLEYRSLSYEESDLEKLHLGSLYRFGSMSLTSGIDANGLSAGVFYALDQINSGIIFSTTRFVKADTEFFTQTVYVQLGWQI